MPWHAASIPDAELVARELIRFMEVLDAAVVVVYGRRRS